MNKQIMACLKKNSSHFIGWTFGGLTVLSVLLPLLTRLFCPQVYSVQLHQTTIP